MNLGDILTVEQGEVQIAPLPFQLAAGETLVAPAAVGMKLWGWSNVPDANAANLIVGSPSIAGNVVSVLCGGYGDAGFQAGAVYSVWATVATSAGRTLSNYGQITCDKAVPPAPSTGITLPSNTIPIAEDTTAAASAIYVITAADLTVSLPETWAPNGGIVQVADLANWGGAVSGNVLSWPSGTTTLPLVPGGSMAFAFSPKLNGWLSI